MKTPQSEAYRQPAEWERHDACWLAWPSHAELWQEDLPLAQSEFVALCRALSGVDVESAEPIERLEILVPDAERKAEAEAALQGLPVRFHLIPFGDIWLRDTAPVFVTGPAGTATVRFGFNGWGGKYELPHDNEVSDRIGQTAGLPSFAFPWVLEGGSVDVDGEGTVLTTRQCLLNKNRNPGMSKAQIEQGLKDSLGVSRVLWIEEGLVNDHTDGHIDTIARFVAPGKVVCMQATDSNDPNAPILDAIMGELDGFVDAKGRRLEIVAIPSPGRIEDEDGRVMPASYVNFYISNRTVVVPTYGSPHDASAVRAIGNLFPGRKTIGLSARAVLSGGGAFHCITQQVPSGAKR